jgi:hypothetical protein
MEMPPRSVERLKELQTKTEASSYAEVVRNALQLYEAMIREIDDGGRILLERDGKTSPLIIFGA